MDIGLQRVVLVDSTFFLVDFTKMLVYTNFKFGIGGFMGAVMLEVVDIDTGEVIQPEKRKRKFKATWFMSDIKGSEVLAKLNLSKNEYRVILMLQSKLSYNNRLFIDRSKLAREFKCDNSMIYKTIDLLMNKEILIKVGEFYKFNNSYVRCGGEKHEE